MHTLNEEHLVEEPEDELRLKMTPKLKKDVTAPVEIKKSIILDTNMKPMRGLWTTKKLPRRYKIGMFINQPISISIERLREFLQRKYVPHATDVDVDNIIKELQEKKLPQGTGSRCKRTPGEWILTGEIGEEYWRYLDDDVSSYFMKIIENPANDDSRDETFRYFIDTDPKSEYGNAIGYINAGKGCKCNVEFTQGDPQSHRVYVYTTVTVDANTELISDYDGSHGTYYLESLEQSTSNINQDETSVSFIPDSSSSSSISSSNDSTTMFRRNEMKRDNETDSKYISRMLGDAAPKNIHDIVWALKKNLYVGICHLTSLEMQNLKERASVHDIKYIQRIKIAPEYIDTVEQLHMHIHTCILNPFIFIFTITGSLFVEIIPEKEYRLYILINNELNNLHYVYLDFVNIAKFRKVHNISVDRSTQEASCIMVPVRYQGPTILTRVLEIEPGSFVAHVIEKIEYLADCFTVCFTPVYSWVVNKEYITNPTSQNLRIADLKHLYHVSPFDEGIATKTNTEWKRIKNTYKFLSLLVLGTFFSIHSGNTQLISEFESYIHDNVYSFEECIPNIYQLWGMLPLFMHEMVHLCISKLITFQDSTTAIDKVMRFCDISWGMHHTG